MGAQDRQQVDLTLDWGSADQNELFLHVESTPKGLNVIAHPGLSVGQVTQAASELGDLGPAVLSAWQRTTGFTASI